MRNGRICIHSRRKTLRICLMFDDFVECNVRGTDFFVEVCLSWSQNNKSAVLLASSFQVI